MKLHEGYHKLATLGVRLQREVSDTVQHREYAGPGTLLGRQLNTYQMYGIFACDTRQSGHLTSDGFARTVSMPIADEIQAAGRHIVLLLKCRQANNIQLKDWKWRVPCTQY